MKFSTSNYYLAWPLILESKQDTDLMAQLTCFLFSTNSILIDMSRIEWTDLELIDKICKLSATEFVIVCLRLFNLI